MARIRGAAVLVTGASSGIGEAVALAFARRQARLALCARRLDRLNAVAEECRRAGSPEVVVRRVDVGHEAEARAFVAAALQAFEGIDVLVNNAGVGWTGELAEMPRETLDAMFATNVMGPVYTIQAALPVLLEQRQGVIVNVASVTGFRAVPYSAAYSATKHALVALSHALRGELSGTGVKVTVVYPGSTDTEFFGQRGPEGPMVHSARHVAEVVVGAARHPRRDVILGPYRLAQLAEPILGGPMDHMLGEYRRRRLRR
ncbi:MAG TPA: SDR family NAD(P)-dependent oxidoreductase [Candidatus Nitrosotalea sp.]|nr:SDR family NAD(P)-dependent oxidoreductase [Candidatus Nitrosotalea sp.]